VYAVFDAAAAGQGGVSKVDVHRRIVVGMSLYPGIGRPYGIAYVPRPTPGKRGTKSNRGRLIAR
jgi:hypothetical protein